MLRDYGEQRYLPATARFRRRTACGARLAKELVAWQRELDQAWPHLQFGAVQVQRNDDRWRIQVPVYLGDIDPAACVPLEASHILWQH
jgi:starch phosphorylase